MNPRVIGFYLLLAVPAFAGGVGLYGITRPIRAAIGGLLS